MFSFVRLRPVLRGIRFRMSMVFFVAFFGMAAVTTWHLQSSMRPTFLRMEQANAIASAERVIGGLDAQLSNLYTLTKDWAVWDDMHQYLRQPTAAFAASNLGAASLKNVGLVGILVLSHRGEVVGFAGLTLANGRTVTAADFAPHHSGLLAMLAGGPWVRHCGYVPFDHTLVLMCGNRIARSDGTGDEFGVLVMARELTPALLKDIEEQSKERFVLIEPAAAPLPASAERWPMHRFAHLAAGHMMATGTPGQLTVDYPLHGFADQTLKTVRLPLSRALMLEGDAVTANTSRQLAAIALVTGAFLFAGGHFWLVLPLARLKKEIREIHKQKNWGATVARDRKDEIGALAREVNGLLGVIRSQLGELEALSMTDALTSVANRRRFDQRLADEVVRCQRTRKVCAVLILDLDYFKQYNDRYGHPAGDVALQTLARLMVKCTRQMDLPARLGGEEFAVLLPDTTEAAAITIAEKIRAALHAAAVAHAGSKVSTVLTASIGVAAATGDAMAAGPLLELADQALYAAKAAGRDRVVAHSTLTPPPAP